MKTIDNPSPSISPLTDLFPGAVLALRADGSECAAGEVGRLVCRLPLPPGFASTLWQADQRFEDTYFKAYPVSTPPSACPNSG